MSDLDHEFLYINGLDGALREKLGKDATERGQSLNDVAVGILAKAFKVEFEPAGGHPGPQTGSTNVNLKLPLPLYDAVDAAAARAPRGSRSKKAVVERVLCEHYGLRYAPPVRRRRRRAAA